MIQVGSLGCVVSFSSVYSLHDVSREVKCMNVTAIVACSLDEGR